MSATRKSKSMRGGVGLLAPLEAGLHAVQVFPQVGSTEWEIRWSTANGLVK